MTTTPTAATTDNQVTVDEHYDYIVIGAGSGNFFVTKELKDSRVAIIEKNRFGGTCLNVGCIPTKMYVQAAETALRAREGSRLGIDAHIDQVRWPDIVERVFSNRIDKIADATEAYRRSDRNPNVTVYDQHASFVAPKTIKTGLGAAEKIISGETIIIAAGSRPVIPEVIADSGVPFYTNEDIMRLPVQPRHLIVLGGGYIAAEFASVFEALGTKVSLVTRSAPLRFVEPEIQQRYEESARERFAVYQSVVSAATTTADGIEILLESGERISGDALLVATGRRPNGDLLAADKAGVAIDATGRVQVDEYGRTTAPGIWALGDISSPFRLKHVANAEERAIYHNVLHPDDLVKLPHENVPAAVFSHPQIAFVGLGEAAAREAGYDITVKIQNYSDVAYGWALEDTTGIVKLIADRASGQLLGAHIYGAEASSLIQPLITALAYRLDMRTFARDQYWIHPALSEVIENAVLGLRFD